MAHLVDETRNHVHTPNPYAKCKACKEMVSSVRKSRSQSGLGKSQDTIRRDEEPLRKA